MPKNYEYKDFLTSLSLFTFYSAQRRCTVLYVKFGNINLIRAENTKQVKRIVIKLKRTKGNQENYNKSTLIHRASDESMCLVRALEKYLISKFNINYDNFEEFQKKNQEKLVWDISKTKYSNLFSYISEKAGYSPGSLSPHSLRGGSVGELMLNENNNTLLNNYELSRIIGGWSTKSTSHRKYVKKMTLSTISCTRLIDPNNKESYCVPALQDPLVVHQLESLQSTWDIGDINYKFMTNKLQKGFILIHSQLLDQSGLGLLIQFFNTILLKDLLFQHCQSHHLNKFTEWRDLQIDGRVISSIYKDTIIYPLLLIDDNLHILYEQFKNAMDTYEAIYSSPTSWYPAEDLFLTTTLIATKYLPIKMENKTIYSICKRYEYLIHTHGDNLEIMQTKCQTNMDNQKLVVVKSGSRWSYEEETFLSDHLINNAKISDKSLKGLMKCLPGRTARGIDRKIRDLQTNGKKIKKTNQEHVYRIDANCNVSKNKKKKGELWTNKENEEFRKAYAQDRSLLNFTNMEIFKNRSLNSLQNVASRLTNLETEDIANTHWSDKDCNLLMDMYAKGHKMDEMLKTFKGRNSNGIRSKITKLKKKLEQQPSQQPSDAINPKKTKTFLKANEQFKCYFICSYMQDPMVENNLDFCESKLKLMKATQQLAIKPIFISFDKSEIRVCHGSHGDIQDILEKKNLLNIQSFDISNPKLKILLIQEKLEFNHPIVYLFTDVCTNATEKMQSNFPEFYYIQLRVNTKEIEIDNYDLENVLQVLQNKLEKIQTIVTYQDINNFLFNFRKWVNYYSELISKKKIITEYHIDDDTFLNLSTFFNNFYTKHKTDDKLKNIMHQIQYPFLSKESIALFNTTTILSFLTNFPSWCDFNNEFNNMIFSNITNYEEDDKFNFRFHKALRHFNPSDLNMFDNIKIELKIDPARQWGLDKYEDYIENENIENEVEKKKLIEAFPVNLSVLQNFMIEMSNTLAVNTINNILIIVHKYHQILGHPKFSKEFMKEVAKTRKQCQKNRDDYCLSNNKNLEGTGKMAAIYLILLHILQSVPSDYPKREFFISCFLFMFNTGARFVTMCNIQIKNLKRVVRGENNKIILLIEAQITKCNKNWQQPLNLEGYIDENNIMNPIFWINETLKNYHGLDLKDFENWHLDDEKLNNYLWCQFSNLNGPIPYTTVYRKFRLFYNNAGIEDKVLGIHSLRSGFYCSAYLSALWNGFNIETMKDLTMHIAGWLHKKDQNVYQKGNFSNMISGSLLMDKNGNGIPIPKDVTIEEFLGVTGKLEPKW
jgi:hypothetical protein